MNKPMMFYIVLASALLFGMLAGAAAEVPRMGIETKGVAKTCLACHGSYDKIREATSNFKAASGEIITPHQYIPHNEKTDIPDCTECHTAHPVPLEDKSKVVLPKNLDWCYSACHHLSNFTPCGQCH
jgi:hypothetical protein